jgi:transmembrane sensor
MKRADPHSELVDTTAAQWVARRDAGLTPAEVTELSEWLLQDEIHVTALARYQATWKAMGRPRRMGAAAELAHEVSSQQRQRRTRRLGAAGAAALVMLVAGFLWSPRTTGDAVGMGRSTVLLTPEIQTLSDGSVVELKTGAEIAVEFTAALRRVRLVRGEAHFTVTKNRARPFVVVASGIEVRAVGTAFSVDRRENSVGLLVTEGRVSVDHTPLPDSLDVSGPPPAAVAEVVPLAFIDAGHQTEIDSTKRSSAPLRVDAVSALDLAERLAWRVPRAEFSGTPLAEVVSVINRHAHERFVIEDPELARVPLSGLFRLEDGAAFQRLMETGFGIQAEHRSDGVIVLRKSRR